MANITQHPAGRVFVKLNLGTDHTILRLVLLLVVQLLPVKLKIEVIILLIVNICSTILH